MTVTVDTCDAIVIGSGMGGRLWTDPADTDPTV